jgi:3,4-dihydroxy 2-butanone 4-phosphate synthase/GTP cyclohydrolase II
MQLLEEAQKGVLIYMRQEGRDIGITNKIKTYALQECGFDTYDANLQIGHKADERDYAVAAQMIQQLQIHSVKLITNNPSKIQGLRQYGINVCSVHNVYGSTTAFNQKYIETKVKRFHHIIPIR